MLVSKMQSDPMPVPGEPGAWMKFRRLTPKRLQDIIDARQGAALTKMAELGEGALAIVTEMKQAAKEAAIKAAEAAAKGQPATDTPRPASNPLLSYDRTLLLVGGIAELGGGTYDGVPIDAATVDDLDVDTSAWAGTEILRLNRLLPDDSKN
jgi:hypothetical protein